MKISKLFHWIYALLMLLPFAFFVPSVLYYAFNDNATMQSVEVPKTETISVDLNQKVYCTSYSNDVCDVVALNDYSCNINGKPYFVDIQFDIPLIENHKYYVMYTNSESFTNAQCLLYFRTFNPNNYPLSTRTSFSSIITALDDSTDLVITTYNDYELVDFSFSLNLVDMTKMFGVGNEPTLDEMDIIYNQYYSYTESELMQITYDTGETEQLVENTSIINYAWESIWDLPLFNWSKVTFVSVPFAYITGLFGIGANSTLNYAFGYFATISICWLVFDVIMYVPMLVHRWIDKARIE